MEQGTEITAGNVGDKAKKDCLICLKPDTSGVLDIRVEKADASVDGDSARTIAEKVCRFFQMISAQVCIQDNGAPGFVVSARMEACIRQAVDTQKSFLPEMLPQNRRSTEKNRIRMSRLYLPGNTPKMMLSAGAHHPHCVILDLEDSVAPAKKTEARYLVRNALRQVDFNGAERMVRINQLPLGLEDIQQIAGHNVHVILIPKCESPDDILAVNNEIDRVRKSTFEPPIFLMPILETCRGILNAEKIAGASDNIAALTIGLEDYTADLGAGRTKEGVESFYARSRLANVCKAYGLQAIDSVFSDFGDPEGLAETVRRSKSLGFQGMGCIHPRQIPIVHEGYAPDGAEIEKAKKIVRAFEDAGKKGLGVVSLGTKMIDPPVVQRAFQVIEKATLLNLMDEK